MTKTVKFRMDEDCEMLEVYVDGKLWRSGNFWDFNFENDLPDILQEVGVKFESEEYNYYDDDEDEQ